LYKHCFIIIKHSNVDFNKNMSIMNKYKTNCSKYQRIIQYDIEIQSIKDLMKFFFINISLCDNSLFFNERIKEKIF